MSTVITRTIHRENLYAPRSRWFTARSEEQIRENG
jgi:hypothetical protein